MTNHVDAIHNLSTGIVSGVVWLAATVLDSGSLVPLGAAASVGAGIWYLASRLQRQDDRLEEIQKTLSTLPCSTTHNCKTSKTVGTVPIIRR
jgi:succinate dehydrogenase/fumarate reductase-like Fe-S protein